MSASQQIALQPDDMDARSPAPYAPPAANRGGFDGTAILMAAIERNASIEQIERLTALIERQTALAEQRDKEKREREAKNAFIAALAEFKAESITIRKSKQVGYWTKPTHDKPSEFVGYKHAELSDYSDAIDARLAQQGLFYRWVPRQADNLIYVDCIVSHRDGHSETVTLFGSPDNSGKKNAIQQVASTIKYLERYTLEAALGLTSRGDVAEDDGNAAGDTDDTRAPFVPMTEDHQATVTTMCEGISKRTLGRVLGHYGKASLAEIADSEYPEIIAKLKNTPAPATTTEQQK